MSSAELRRGAHLPYMGLEPVGGKPQSLWHMATASPDLQSPSQPQSLTALSPVPSYAAWWQKHTGVSSLPKATAQWCRGRTRTCDL